jgi:hypothetical protein
VNGIVFDAPQVIIGAENAIREAGLAGRCRAIDGDFFRGVPAGRDAVCGPDDDRGLLVLFLRYGTIPPPVRAVRVRRTSARLAGYGKPAARPPPAGPRTRRS